MGSHSRLILKLSNAQKVWVRGWFLKVKAGDTWDWRRKSGQRLLSYFEMKTETFRCDISHGHLKMLTQNCTANKAGWEDIEIFHYEEVINTYFFSLWELYFPSTFFLFFQVSTEELRITQWWLQPTRWPALWELLLSPQRLAGHSSLQ